MSEGGGGGREGEREGGGRETGERGEGGGEKTKPLARTPLEDGGSTNPNMSLDLVFIKILNISVSDSSHKGQVTS
jgi:hypothetical protein